MYDLLVHHFRMSFFSTETDVLDGTDCRVFFQQLTGSEPDFLENRPKVHSARLQGDFDGKRVELLISPKRLDLVWIGKSAVELPGINGEDIEDAAAFKYSDLNTVVAYFDHISALLKKIIRTAMAGMAYRKFDTIEDAYSSMNKFFPELRLDYGKVEDFQCQKNMPEYISIGGENLKINRILNVCVRQSSLILGYSRISEKIPTSIWLQISFDANTNPENYMILDENLPEIKSSLEKSIKFIIKE